MRNFQQKQRFKNILHSKIILTFFGILVLFFAWGVIGFMGKMKVTRENRKIAENKVAELEREKEKLSSDIAKLKSPDGIEESIREKFGLAKEGEGLIVVVEDKKKVEAENEESGWFLSFIKNLFK